MSTKENKAATSTLFARFTAGDPLGALGTMTKEAAWWIAGKKDRSPSAGMYTKDKTARLFH